MATFNKILIALVFYSFSYSSCSQKTEHLSPDSSSILIGKWDVYAMNFNKISGTLRLKDSEMGDGLVICNECPEIIFNLDNTGYLKTANGLTENFIWQDERLKIFISSRNKNLHDKSTHPILADGPYEVVIKKAPEGLTKIELVDSIGIEYVLLKE